jgi:hydroxyacylglutathione hydrolase
MIRGLGRRAQDVALIVITHWHADHMRGAEELRRGSGARVAVHELDAEVLAGGELPAKGRRVQEVIRRVFRVRPVAADLLLHDGDEVAGWQVVHMPGHTAGSIALHREGVVFTGDALRCDRHGRVLLPDPRLSLDPEAAVRSVERIRALNPDLVLPGHGAPARLPQIPHRDS